MGFNHFRYGWTPRLIIPPIRWIKISFSWCYCWFKQKRRISSLRLCRQNWRTQRNRWYLNIINQPRYRWYHQIIRQLNWKLIPNRCLIIIINCWIRKNHWWIISWISFISQKKRIRTCWIRNQNGRCLTRYLNHGRMYWCHLKSRQRRNPNLSLSCLKKRNFRQSLKSLIKTRKLRIHLSLSFNLISFIC